VSHNEIIIEAGHSEVNYWRDLWRYRELFYFLAWRDILVRYKQTVVGIGWAVIRPLLTTIVLTVVFSRVAKLPSPGSAPYALLVFAGMLPWQFFSNALSESSNSLIGSSNLISKVYFPRLIVPGSAVVTSFADSAIMLALMAAMMLWYGYLPNWQVLTLPFFILLAFGAAFGSGLLLAALNVKYRDFRYIVPFILQFGVYISPVGFSSDRIPSNWRLLYASNPLVGIIDGFRWALLGGVSPLWWPGLVASVVTTSLCCAVGISYFRRTEKRFADII
jgi:lipopolysaccharide transport system permease protein